MAEHVHKFLPTLDQLGEEATKWFGWCECGDTLDLSELCKRANATERLSAKDAKVLLGDYPETYTENIQAVNSLRAYADTLEGK